MAGGPVLLASAGTLGAGGVTLATITALDAGTINALGVFLGGLAALVSAVVALVALLKRKDPAEYFAEGVRYGQEQDQDTGDGAPSSMRRRRR